MRLTHWVTGAALALAACQPTLDGQPRVIDGDTIVVGGVHVRLNGLDAEELFEPHGTMARDAMRRIAGAYVSCTLNGDRSYDRMVGTCINSRGEDIAAALVTQGLALDCPRYSHGRYRNNETAWARQVLRQKGYCQ